MAALSQENIEIVKAIFRGWDDAGVEGMLPFFHQDIEYLPMEEGATVHGFDSLLRYFERWTDRGRPSGPPRPSFSPMATTS